MDHAVGQAGQVLYMAHELYARANSSSTNSTSGADTQSRPASYKIIGIILAVSSGLFIGTSFVLKKVGLLKANVKYNEAAGDGYGYLKNPFWWSGMILMILGEGCNFAALAFTDAILVTPLGAVTVVVTTILSAIFLKERLSMIGKISCFLCIVGSIVIALNAPQESSVANIQEMQKFVIMPGFLSFAGVVILGSAFVAWWVGPRYGKKNMLVYISICSWIGGLSVAATQGLGAAIVAQAGGTPQFNQWFVYVVLVFMMFTLATEIIFLNKALNLFNAAMVTPTYYVYFTSTTIITSSVLFQGFKGTVASIITIVMGFLTICAGVVLLQLSKSAKDVPDATVFNGNLDQIRPILDQEQPETEPKADAIRGTAAILRRFSTARRTWEQKEAVRVIEERELDRLEAVSEEGQAPLYEWDGIRRRRTTIGSERTSRFTASLPPPSRGGANTPFPPTTEGAPPSPTRANTGAGPFTPPVRTPRPPLGMSRIPTAEEEAEWDRLRPVSPLSSIVGTIRARTRSVFSTRSDARPASRESTSDAFGVPRQGRMPQSPMHPVHLTEIAVPTAKASSPLDLNSPYRDGYGGAAQQTPYKTGYASPSQAQTAPTMSASMAYEGAAGVAAGSPVARADSSSTAGGGRHIHFAGNPRHTGGGDGLLGIPTPPPPLPPPHGAKRQFSFQNVFRRQSSAASALGSEDGTADDAPTRRHHTPDDRPRSGISSRGYPHGLVRRATEEERLGLVQGGSHAADGGGGGGGRRESGYGPVGTSENEGLGDYDNDYRDDDDDDYDDDLVNDGSESFRSSSNGSYTDEKLAEATLGGRGGGQPRSITHRQSPPRPRGGSGGSRNGNGSRGGSGGGGGGGIGMIDEKSATPLPLVLSRGGEPLPPPSPRSNTPGGASDGVSSLLQQQQQQQQQQQRRRDMGGRGGNEDGAFI